MKRAVIIAAAVIGAVVLVRRLVSLLTSIDWVAKLAAMPSNTPCGWMFSHVRAIRENTERILELAQSKSRPQGS